MKMVSAIFLLAAKDISEQNTPNNKFHDITFKLTTTYIIPNKVSFMNFYSYICYNKYQI